MKKFAILGMICLLLTACSAATSASSGNAAESVSSVASADMNSTKVSDEPTSSVPVLTVPPSLEKSVEIWYAATEVCGNNAVKDGDTVFFSAVNILAKITPEGEIVALQERKNYIA